MKVVLLAVLLLAMSCGSNPLAKPTTTSGSAWPIMAQARLSPAQLVAWFKGRIPQPTGEYAATAPIEALARFFVDEGAAEGVTGDVAFVQSIIETGSFRFGGVVRPAANNFAGIGATLTGPPSAFADARTGVRAQIQHLRAYADPTAASCTMPPLARPCVDPRFHLVRPKGRAPTWNLLGSGNWAAARDYGLRIVLLYQEVLRFHGLGTK